MQSNYHQQLIAAYEDEIGGMDYFEALLGIFVESHQQEKLRVLVELEKQTSTALFELIKKYNLQPQTREHIRHKAIVEAKQSQNKTWHELMDIFSKEFPPYVDQFKETLALAPIEDKSILQQTIEHEVALISFVEQELQQTSNSLPVVQNHLRKYA